MRGLANEWRLHRIGKTRKGAHGPPSTATSQFAEIDEDEATFFFLNCQPLEATVELLLAPVAQWIERHFAEIEGRGFNSLLGFFERSGEWQPSASCGPPSGGLFNANRYFRIQT